jgi:hypothetical protein
MIEISSKLHAKVGEDNEGYMTLIILKNKLRSREKMAPMVINPVGNSGNSYPHY